MRTRKRWALCVCGLFLVLSVGLTGEAHAALVTAVETETGSAEVAASGKEGKISWQLTADGVLELNGTGELAAMTEDGWGKYKEKISTIRIGEGITGLSGNCFKEYTRLQSVELPESLSKIGCFAFSGCSALESIAIPGQVEEIPFEAFSSCQSLSRIVLPENLKTIDYGAFSGCSALTEIQLPSTVTEIGGYAFWNCDSLKSIEIPSHVKEIGGDTFYHCESLTHVGLPEGLETIGSTAFKDCSALTDIQIPSTVTEIGNYAFHGCSSLKALVLLKGITYIGDEEFYGCSSLKSLVIPDGVTSIGNSAFSGCSNLESIVLPDSVQVLLNTNTAWGSTFENCNSLKTICFGGTSKQWNALDIPLKNIPTGCQVICLGDSAGTIASDQTTTHAAGLTVSPDSICLDVGFYLQGSPNGPVSIALMEQQLNAIRPYSDTIRLYSASGEINKAYSLAKTLGFRVVGSAWLSGDREADQKELDALVKLCQDGLCCAAVVGSETLLRGDLTPAELISDMSYVRERIAGTGIPVTTADSIDCILQNDAVRNACDYLFVNAYAYWDGVSIEKAAESFIASVESLKAQCPGKEVIISETGWPTEGDAKGSALPGEQAAASYFAAVRQWALESDTVVFWFDAADEPWKAAAEGTVGAHWGLLTKDCDLKPGYQALDFFQTADTAAGSSNFQKTHSLSGSPFADVKATDWYYQNVCSVYEYGLMNGTGNDRFSPAGTLTVAEAVTLACRLYTDYHGYSISFPAGENWYDGYVAYAKAVNLIEDDQFTDYSQPISRRDIAVIFARAMPEKAFESIHTVTSIPDVDKSSQGYASILQLYAAGILTGTDAAGNFFPEKTVTRAESAAIMTRMVDPVLRK